MYVFIDFPVSDNALELIKKEFKDLYIVSSYEEADAYLIETEIPPVTSRVRIIQAITAGVNHIVMSNIPKGVAFCSNAGAYSDYVAEHAIALLLSFYKKIPDKVEQMREGIFMPENVGTLKGKSIAIIGYGGIGRAVARLAKSFRMGVRAYGRRPNLADENCDSYTTSLDDVFGSDIYLITLPYTKHTEGLVDETLLNKMGSRAILVNVARAGIVKKESLLRYCETNKEFYYLTDVWWDEPNIGSIPWKNIMATPHIAGGISEQAFMEAFRNAVSNIDLFFKGHPQNVVDRAEYEGLVGGAPALRKIAAGLDKAEIWGKICDG